MYCFFGWLAGLVLKSCPTLETPWTVACKVSLPMGLSRQEYWSGLPFPSPGNLPDPGIKPGSPALQASQNLRKPENSWLHRTSRNKRPYKSLHTYTKTNHHPRANKLQNKTYHTNSLATQEHRPKCQHTCCPKSHLTHRPIAKLITGHSIALQREEIHFHAPEHWHKLP